MLKWGVERRLEFIEFRLFWEGGVNRSDIIGTFDVSVPQASKDLTHYQERAPHNTIYDKSAKRYVASPQFSPIFLKPDPDTYLSRLRSLATAVLLALVADDPLDSRLLSYSAGLADIFVRPLEHHQIAHEAGVSIQDDGQKYHEV